MSNYLAIATVTATLHQLITKAVQVVPDAKVTAGRPKEPPPTGEPTANIYLYHVVPNAALRNDDLPTRRDNATLIQRPQIALDLQYLITFYDDGSLQLAAQRMLGSTVSILHAQPLLTPAEIHAAITTAPFDTQLAASDLEQQVAAVRLTPVTLNLEELSRLWTVFSQTTHALSIAYNASVVLIEADDVPSQDLPVREPRVITGPHHIPQIEEVRP
jgi:hypothetical protein